MEILGLTGLAMAKLAVHLATNATYGFHRDELYYLASGRHPALGYVDYPPLTPLLARFELDLFGPSVFWLRLFPALAGVILVVLAGLIAAELGGGTFARLAAATATLACPLLLATNWLFQTVAFDQLAWMVALFMVARLLRTGDGRWWLGVGVVLGVGLETKYTILALCLGLAVGLLATRRRDLVTPWPWLGALAALLLWAPNLAWQATHGWVSVQYILQHPSNQASLFSPVAFLAGQLAIGPLAVPLWLAGWSRLLRHREARLLGVAALVAFGTFMLVGKAYYAGPLYPLLLAGGAVALDSVVRGRAGWLRPAAIVAVTLNGILLLPFLIPIVPTAKLHAYHLDGARTDYADTVGWPGLVDQVAAVYDSLPAAERRDATILASNYGEAGALDLYGPARGLPPAISVHLTYYFWKPAHVDDRTVIVVGYSADDVSRYFADVEPVASITMPNGVSNEEVGQPILIARQPRVPLDQLWPQMPHLN
jgi:hypothetical protein